MKNYLTLLFIVSLTFSGTAQIIFCPAGAVWKSIHTRSWPDQTLETETVTYTGKQFIGSDTVKVLSHKRFYLDINQAITSTTHLKQKGDTVFFKNARTQNNWQVLYNFAAQIGDKWYNTLDASRLYTITVTSIQTVAINGTALKQMGIFQHHNGNNRNDFNYTITERLGSSLFVFTFGGKSSSDGDNWMENLCYTDSSIGTYQYSSKACNYTTLLGTTESTSLHSDLTVFPNPTSANLALKLENRPWTTNYNFCLRNMIGQKIREGEVDLTLKNVEIKTQDLPEGIYSISLKGNEGATEIVKRFVKTGN